MRIHVYRTTGVDRFDYESPKQLGTTVSPIPDAYRNRHATFPTQKTHVGVSERVGYFAGDAGCGNCSNKFYVEQKIMDPLEKCEGSARC